jgi:hypothetical protein
MGKTAWAREVIRDPVALSITSNRMRRSRTPAGEFAGVLDRGCDRRGGDRADAGNGHQPLGRLIRLDRRRKLFVDRSDRLIQRVDLADKRTKCAAHAIGDDDLAILVEAVGSHALQAIGMLRALRRDEADLGQMARKAIERRRALAGSSSRARWRINAAWFSIERTGTNRWPGRLIAS